MPPHPQMSPVCNSWCLRALVSKFWKTPYHGEMVHWGTSIHDKFMLPHFLWQDLGTVVQDLNDGGYPIDLEWFRPHYEFRCRCMAR